MGRALILLESLATALLLVALAAAWVSASPRRLSRWGLPVAVMALIALPAAVLAFALHFLYQHGTVSLLSFVTATGWTTAFLLGSMIVLREVQRSAPPGGPWSVRGLALASLIAAILTAITVSNLDVAVKGQMAALRVEAGAKAVALAPPRSTEALNAAPLYRRAFAALTPADQLPALLRDHAQVWQSYDRTAFDPSDPSQRDFLDSQQRGLALLRAAAAVPHCVFERDWSSDNAPIDIHVPELLQLRHGATLLAYDALARAGRGDRAGALDDVTAIFHIARHVPYPLLIDLLTAATIEKTGAKALQDVLALAPGKGNDLARLDLTSVEPFRERLRRAFAMEEAWGMAAFVMIATGHSRATPELQAVSPLDALGEALLDSPVYRVFFMEEDLAAYRRHLRTMREAAAQPAPALLDGFDKLEHEIRATRGGGILAGLLLPATFKGLYAAQDGDAVRSLVQLALAAAAYKEKHGQYPDKLADLVPAFVPEIAPDPYDGRPLRLRRAGNEVVLYSIGADRKDDGGRGWDEDKREGDLTFRLR